MKMGLGVSIGLELLLLDPVESERGVDVVEQDTLLVLLELELVGVGAGTALTTVVVTSCVMVGPGLTTWTVLVGLTIIVACAASDEPPSTLMTE
jgi:hypothetical protein